MNVSPNAYEKAKEILTFVSLNPGSHMQIIADEVQMLKVTAHIIVQKMIQADVLTFTSRRYRGGKRYFYQVTGKPLPARIPTQKVKAGQTEKRTDNDQVSEQTFVALPSFIRAITPVKTSEPVNAVGFYGHTKEQHMRQSQIIRKDRATAQRGAIPSGVSRL